MKLHLPLPLRRAVCAVLALTSVAATQAYASTEGTYALTLASEDDSYFEVDDIVYENKTTQYALGTYDLVNSGGSLLTSDESIEWSPGGEIRVANNVRKMTYHNTRGNSIWYYGGMIRSKKDITWSDSDNVYLNNNDLNVSGTHEAMSFTWPEVFLYGGAVYASGAFTLSNCGSVEICGNAISAAAAEVGSSADIGGCGGAIYASSITISGNKDVQITDNSVSFYYNMAGDGGALYSTGAVTFSGNRGDIAISRNKAIKYGAAIRGTTVSFQDNKGKILISENSTKKGEAAIYCTALTMTGNADIEFSSNICSEGYFGSGASVVYASSGDVTLEGNGNVLISSNSSWTYNFATETNVPGTAFQVSKGNLSFISNADITIRENENTVFSSGNVDISKNQEILIQDNYGFASVSGTVSMCDNAGIQLMDNDYNFSRVSNIILRGNDDISITGTGDSAVSATDTVTVQNNGNITIQNNAGTGIYGGSVVELAGNENVSIQSNSGYGISGGSLSLYGNKDVVIRGNGSNGELLAIKLSGEKTELSAAAGHKVEIHGQSSISASGGISLNGDYEDAQGKRVQSTGDIILSGEYADADLATLKGASATTEELANAEKYDFTGLVTLKGGQLILKDGVAVTMSRLVLADGRSATLALSGSSLSGNQGVYSGNGHTLQFAGVNTLTCDTWLLSRNAVVDIRLNANHKDTAALTFNGVLINGGFTFNLSAEETLAPGSYALLTLGEESKWYSVDSWTKDYVSITGLDAAFEDLVWNGSTLYLNYKTTSPIESDFANTEIAWDASYSIPASGYREVTVSTGTDLSAVCTETGALALTVNGYLGASSEDCSWWIGDTPLFASKDVIISGRAGEKDGASFTDVNGLVVAPDSSLTIANMAEVLIGMNNRNAISGNLTLTNNRLVLLNANTISPATGGNMTLSNNGQIIVSGNACSVVQGASLVLSNNECVYLLDNKESSALAATGDVLISGNTSILAQNNLCAFSSSGNLKLENNQDIGIERSSGAAIYAWASVEISGNTNSLTVGLGQDNAVKAEVSVSLLNNAAQMQFIQHELNGIYAKEDVTISGNTGIIALEGNGESGIKAGKKSLISDNEAQMVFLDNKYAAINADEITLSGNKSDMVFQKGKYGLIAPSIMIANHSDASLYFRDFSERAISASDELTIQKNAYLEFSSSEGEIGVGLYAWKATIQGNELLYFSNIDSPISFSTLNWLNNKAALFENNTGSAVRGSNLTMSSEKGGSLVFSDNSSSTGSAIYITSSGLLTGYTNIAMNRNEASSKGGAMYSEGELEVRSVESLLLQDNKASYGGAFYTKNSSNFSQIGSLRMLNNQATSQQSATKGGAVYVTANQMDMSNIQNLEFSGNAAFSSSSTTGGGAVALYNGGGLYMQQNGDVLFSSNCAVSEFKEAKGGAIHSEIGLITLNNNDSLVFTGNYASSINARGGAIYCTDSIFQMIGNDYVEFRGNYEQDGSDYRLRSLYYTDAYVPNAGSLLLFTMSAPDKGKIAIYDSIYVDARNNDMCLLNVDSGSTMASCGGDIVFSGATTEADLKALKGMAPTVEELELSRTSEIMGLVFLGGGRLIVQDNAILKTTGLHVSSASANNASELYLQNGTLDMNWSGGLYDLSVYKNCTLRACGNSDLRVG